MVLTATVIVLVHGAWLNAASWGPFADRLRSRGYEVVAPSWPDVDGDPKALRAAVPPIAQRDVGLDEIVASYADVIRHLPEPPILIGHSFGGLVVERLLDEGLGAAGVALDPAPAKGILPTPRAFATSFPVLFHPHAVVQIHERAFAHTFANAMSPGDAAAAWDADTVPTPTRPFFQVALGAKATKLDWHDDTRAPLLIVAGGRDRTVSPGMIHAAYLHWTRHSKAVTAWKEYPDHSHFLVVEPGFAAVADDSLDWLEQTLHLPSTRAP
jgi:pimeloyl-ACP methyl ester carboxylesterase